MRILLAGFYGTLDIQHTGLRAAIAVLFTAVWLTGAAARETVQASGADQTGGSRNAAGASGPSGERAQLRPGMVFQECRTCPEMVILPSGTFQMGDLDRKGEADEKPVRFMSISDPIAMSRGEVTVSEFAEFVKVTGHSTGNTCWTYEDDRLAEREGRTWQSPGYTVNRASPVSCVSWIDARRYVEWLSSIAGASYSLPSEAIWEYAARAGTTTPFSWGTQMPSCNPAQTHAAANRWCEPRGPKIVRTFRPNNFGLFDMHGNVWEWVLDCWNETYKDLPTDGSPAGVGNCSRAVLRGGSWLSLPKDHRVSLRNWVRRDSRYSTIGFRVIRLLSADEKRAVRAEQLNDALGETGQEDAGQVPVNP